MSSTDEVERHNRLVDALAITDYHNTEPGFDTSHHYLVDASTDPYARLPLSGSPLLPALPFPSLQPSRVGSAYSQVQTDSPPASPSYLPSTNSPTTSSSPRQPLPSTTPTRYSDAYYYPQASPSQFKRLPQSPRYSDQYSHRASPPPSPRLPDLPVNEDAYAMYGGPTDGESNFDFNLGSDGDSQRPIRGRSESGLTSVGRSVRSGLGSYMAGPEDWQRVEMEKVGSSRAGGGGGKRRGKEERLSPKARKWFIAAGIVALLIIGIAAATAAVLKRDSTKSAKLTGGVSYTSTMGTTTTTAPFVLPTQAPETNWKTAAWGGDGSTVYTEDGSSFLYNNTFGGFWNAVPYNDSARAQSDTPPLSTAWDYSRNLITGVNLGGWLLLEPFITPSLFEPYNSATDNPNATNGAVDEWTLSLALGSNMANVITNHYATFITEKDFAEIAGAGLNWVRLPFPYWLIEVQAGEPFLANVGWTYLLKAIEWARKYGLRINLDLHAVPGSQNGYNHSSKLGTVNFLNGVMGIVNAQRTLNYIRTITEFISQPQYTNVVPMFSVLNEPRGQIIGVDALRRFWKTGYSNVAQAIVNPLWNYQLGLEQGFIPKDPRTARGACPNIVAAANENAAFNSVIAPPLSAWMTGGQGAGTMLAPAQVSSYVWPPTVIGLLGETPVSHLPTLTTTGSIFTMSAATPTSYPAGYSSSVSPGNGWFDASDNKPWYTAVSGCSYPNAWSGIFSAIPTAACTGNAGRRAKRVHRDTSESSSTSPTPPPKPYL
ncbi:glucan 1,3-beta-glucosidase, partial [Phenoliferia sp. Uapishka_3]